MKFYAKPQLIYLMQIISDSDHHAGYLACMVVDGWNVECRSVTNELSQFNEPRPVIFAKLTRVDDRIMSVGKLLDVCYGTAIYTTAGENTRDYIKATTGARRQDLTTCLSDVRISKMTTIHHA